MRQRDLRREGAGVGSRTARSQGRGAAVYLFFATAIGLFLGTGSNTPLESVPPWLATILQASPTLHFVSLAQAILYRGAGFAVVWRQFVIVALIG
ncbi:MAG TPA: hypothetical protein VGK96_24550, partial [Candidatus Sulfotelmatobacter sp.]